MIMEYKIKPYFKMRKKQSIAFQETINLGLYILFKIKKLNQILKFNTFSKFVLKHISFIYTLVFNIHLSILVKLKLTYQTLIIFNFTKTLRHVKIQNRYKVFAKNQN